MKKWFSKKKKKEVRKIYLEGVSVITLEDGTQAIKFEELEVRKK